MSSNGNSVSSSKPADTRDAKEKEKERLKELEKEAERERERIREKEIRAFREFSTTLPIKQTRRSRGASFVQEQQEAAAKAQSAALQAQWGSLNSGGGAGNVGLGMNSMGIGGGGGHGGVAGSYLSSLGGGDMGGGVGNKALRSGGVAGLHPVSPLHGVGGAGPAGHLNSMNANNSGAGYGGTDMAYSNNVNAVLQQQMQMGEQHLASSIAMNAHGRKTPRAVALTMPPLQQQDSGGGQGVGSGLGAAQQRLRAGGRPHIASQPGVGSAGAGGMWDPSAAALGGGMNGMSGGGGAPWQTPQQQQQQMGGGGFGGGHMMNSGPSPALSALPNINMNPTFGNMNVSMNNNQQQQLQGNSRPMQPTQMQYGYEQQDFAHQQHQQQMQQQQQHQQHLLQQQQMGNVGANSNYSGMQQQLNTRRSVLSRENGPSLAGPVGGLGIGLTPLSGGVLGAYSNSNGLSNNGIGGYAHMGNAPPLQHLQQQQQHQQQQQQYSSPHHHQQQQQQQLHHPPQQLQQQAPQHQHQPHGHRNNAVHSNLRNGNSVRTLHFPS